MPLSRLTGDVIGYLHDRRAVEHALKVYAYALGIGGEEGTGQGDMLVLGAAALLHDIGIPNAKERHGSAAGPYQEAEGERLAPEFLERAGVPKAVWECVGRLIGRHHTESAAKNNPLLQILMEADYLVNFSEGNLPGREPRDARDAFFRTGTGIRYMNALYGL